MILRLIDTDETGWKTLIDFTTLDEQGVSAKDILTSLADLNITDTE